MEAENFQQVSRGSKVQLGKLKEPRVASLDSQHDYIWHHCCYKERPRFWGSAPSLRSGIGHLVDRGLVQNFRREWMSLGQYHLSSDGIGVVGHLVLGMYSAMPCSVLFAIKYHEEPLLLTGYNFHPIHQTHRIFFL
ncbi:hypothetical protein RRG08_041832 [Elysia crispata]|uniref:Uncharacterized protein n=1 Tax=Elysia crispata TaxID=231223 RepID=A0AAE0Y0H7_9GAST|nr:hypothetical protein RRG08_041832 [Elysia crispata]